ncbi:hypothetical protein, partial [uncultured Duncaniella sp.]
HTILLILSPAHRKNPLTQNIETAGVQKGGNKIPTIICHLERLYFIIFQSLTRIETIIYLPPRRVVAGGKRIILNISQSLLGILSSAVP